MKTIIRKVNLPYDIDVFATDLSSATTTAYYDKATAKQYGDKVIRIRLAESSPVFLKMNYSDDEIGISETIEIETARITVTDGEYFYE